MLQRSQIWKLNLPEGLKKQKITIVAKQQEVVH